jgi:L-ascorbate metabolism protein UlaG (beta-lactamase superfamily)
MAFGRREILKLGFLGMASMTGSVFMPLAVGAQNGTDSYETGAGRITIHPISHASFVMTAPDLVIYSDPVGGAGLYQGQPRPDLILLTHEHPDHFDPETLSALVRDTTRLITNPAVFDKLPDDLKGKAQAIGNGESTTVGKVRIEAIPAYNITPERVKYHPKGRDNGYILNVDGRRVYIAGDTEDAPEMRALKDIFIAFVPMNLPYTMDVAQASSAVAQFAPEIVYPYHYKGSDPHVFAAMLAKAPSGTKVIFGNWYE